MARIKKGVIIKYEEIDIVNVKADMIAHIVSSGLEERVRAQLSLTKALGFDAYLAHEFKNGVVEEEFNNYLKAVSNYMQYYYLPSLYINTKQLVKREGVNENVRRFVKLCDNYHNQKPLIMVLGKLEYYTFPFASVTITRVEPGIKVGCFKWEI